MSFYSVITIAIPVAVLVAFCFAIQMMIDAAKAKGYAMDKTGLIWFVGIFATPIVVGLYVNALPDIRESNQKIAQ